MHIITSNFDLVQPLTSRCHSAAKIDNYLGYAPDTRKLQTANGHVIIPRCSHCSHHAGSHRNLRPAEHHALDIAARCSRMRAGRGWGALSVAAHASASKWETAPSAQHSSSWAGKPPLAVVNPHLLLLLSPKLDLRAQLHYRTNASSAELRRVCALPGAGYCATATGSDIL